MKKEMMAALAARNILKGIWQLIMFLKTISRLVSALPWIFVMDPDTRTDTGGQPDVSIQPFHPPRLNCFFICSGTCTAARGCC